MSAPAPMAAAMLGWMRRHGDVLRDLLADEGAADVGSTPAGDAAIRAHLRFAAAALLATATPPLRDELEGFAQGLPGWLDESRPLLERHLVTGAGAMALEEHLQFGVRPGADPSLDAALERRLRIGGWIRILALGLETHLGPGHDGLAGQVLDWMGGRHRELSRLILSLDRELKAAARRAAPGGALDLATQDEIGQAANVQGHVRMLVEALGATLGDDPA
ncbi:hypothetical protein [Miltoncostaea marina]|uniref:hypothetical protein n=1 Tax=Miltoncostaea marina TaxID=2843215 RepID=UPI001C3CD5EE|nr:hypothetical protein [Miltoncostaea marina]